MIVFFLVSCSQGKKTQAESRNEVLKNDVYSNIQKIAEALPMDYKKAHDFFSGLDSTKNKSFRRNNSQQFQYNHFTVFYEQAWNRKVLAGVGIDLDTTSHVDMNRLAEQLNSKWHSVNLVEIKKGRTHYTADYVDSKNRKKKIRITLGILNQSPKKDSEVTFIAIDLETEKKKDYNL